MHAAGHAALAFAAGSLLRGLGDQAMDTGSTRHPFGSPADLVWIALSGLAAAVAKLVGASLAARAEATAATAVGTRVRQDVLEHVFEVAHGKREAAAGEPLAALTVHVAEVEAGVLHGVIAEGRALAQLVPLAGWLLYLAPALASRAALAFVGFGLLVFAVRRAAKRSHADAQASAARLVAAADEAVKHAELWASYGATARIRAHLARASRAMVHEAVRVRVHAAWISSMSEVLAAAALLLVLWLAARGFMAVDARTLAPFAIGFFMAYRPLRELIEGRLARLRGERALARALPDGLRGAIEVAEPPPSKWTLERLVIEDAETAYGKHPPLSMSIAPGTIVAIVGPTGVGKTTLLRALLGLEALTGGDVRYGQHRLRRAGVGPSERPFAWVPQDAPVLRETLDVNIGLGGQGGPALLDLPKREGVLDPDALSGGERQWIAVARALSTGLPVLLLDEPTSALDASAQKRLLDAIACLRGQRTVLLVTHRPEPLAIADVVIRLDAEPVKLTA
jgi:ABC-type multidrug transport system fused ATPase/permease subunit